MMSVEGLKQIKAWIEFFDSACEKEVPYSLVDHHCPECGFVIHKVYHYCPFCGQRVVEENLSSG